MLEGYPWVGLKGNRANRRRFGGPSKKYARPSMGLSLAANLYVRQFERKLQGTGAFGILSTCKAPPSSDKHGLSSLCLHLTPGHCLGKATQRSSTRTQNQLQRQCHLNTLSWQSNSKIFNKDTKPAAAAVPFKHPPAQLPSFVRLLT